MTVRQIKLWYLVHKWTSLVCTLFLLMLCLTGLPLIFSEEIDGWLSGDAPYADLPASTPLTNLDDLIARSQAMYPEEYVRFVVQDDDAPRILVTLTPDRDAQGKKNHTVEFDARTGELRQEIPSLSVRGLSVMQIVLSIHMRMMADLPGELFLGLMGLLFVAAIVSGVVLYSPFMRKLAFGTVRAQRSTRLRWLDLHNLLGIVTAGWVLVVGATGVINELSTPLFDLWRVTELKTMLAPYRGQAMPAQSELAPVQRAYDAVREILPNNTLISIVYPDDKIGSPHHFLIWTKGASPVTARLFTPVLVDALSGKVTDVAHLPWYLKTLELSRPLHFGDYGGLPLKIIWALLDIAAIVVLGSGVYLWLSRRKSPLEARLAEIESGAA